MVKRISLVLLCALVMFSTLGFAFPDVVAKTGEIAQMPLELEFVPLWQNEVTITLDMSLSGSNLRSSGGSYWTIRYDRNYGKFYSWAQERKWYVFSSRQVVSEQWRKSYDSIKQSQYREPSGWDVWNQCDGKDYTRWGDGNSFRNPHYDIRVGYTMIPYQSTRRD